MKKQWWHGRTAMQIYPKSFYDANGDGIGDLRGIIEKLDYIKSIGVDIIWISPIYRSPFVDQGYDISDYYQIDPGFGTMEDMEELLREAKKRDMYILMDLVVNHCSSEHALFKKALADPEGEYGQYFYFRKGKGNGQPPCNWRAYFGGSVWEKVPGQDDLWYLHLFAKEQPDLNWENPALRRRVYDMIRWWLEKGLAGFRIDAIINIKKDLSFRDYPADRDDGMCSVHNMLKHASGIGDFLLEMRHETFDRYNALAIAEAFDIKDGELPLFVGDDGYFSSIFDFSTEGLCKSRRGYFASGLPSVTEVRDTLYKSQAEMGDHGFFCNIIENHDEPRGASRYLPVSGQNDAGKKLLGLLMHMRRGMPFLYQGQEIGMMNYPFRNIDEIEDIGTLNEYRVALAAGLSEDEALAAVSLFSRDNARTPVQWSDDPQAGFTTADTPWFPVNPNYREINVRAQEKDPDSVLNFYRSLGALRRDPAYAETIVYGTFEPVLQEYSDLYAFFRRSAGKQLLVLGNMSEKEVTVPVPAESGDPHKDLKVVLNNLKHLEIQKNRITLAPWQGVILDVT